MVIKVGVNVPMMEPMVLNASRFPTTRPFSSRESVVYFTRHGVVVPRRNRGNTKITTQETKAAMMRKFVLTEKISRADTPSTTYFPATGIRAIHTAAMRIRR